MFAALVIALPSLHTGGTVLASFGDRTMYLDTAETSEFGYSYLAWRAEASFSFGKIG